MKKNKYGDSIFAEIEPLPCPFCGGTDLRVMDSGVHCMNNPCGAGIDFGHFFGNDDYESKQCQEAVIGAWNKRAYQWSDLPTFSDYYPEEDLTG